MWVRAVLIVSFEAALMRLPVFRSLADLTSAGVRPIVLNSPYSWVSQSR